MLGDAGTSRHTGSFDQYQCRDSYRKLNIRAFRADGNTGRIVSILQHSWNESCLK